MTAPRRYFHPRSGQALTEFVTVFVMFMLTLLFAMQLSLIANSNALLSVASYNAARKYALTQSENVAQKTAELYLKDVAEKDSVEVKVLKDEENFDFGKPFKLRTSFAYSLLQVPVITELFGKVTKPGSVSQRLVTWKGENPPTREDLRVGDDETMTLVSSEARYSKVAWTVTYDHVYSRRYNNPDPDRKPKDITWKDRWERDVTKVFTLDPGVEPTPQNLFGKIGSNKGRGRWLQNDANGNDGKGWTLLDTKSDALYNHADTYWVKSATSRPIDMKRGEWLVLISKEKREPGDEGKVYLSRWVSMTSE